jgi:hypothetical protein
MQNKNSLAAALSALAIAWLAPSIMAQSMATNPPAPMIQWANRYIHSPMPAM